jgi:hypothetical protein
MKYPIGEELRQYEHWVDTRLRPRMIDALQLPAGKMIESLSLIKKGVKLVEYLGRAKNVEKQIKRLDK